MKKRVSSLVGLWWRNTEQKIGREGVVDLKWTIKGYWGNSNVCDISFLNLETLYGRGKATVDGIVHAIAITSYNFIALCETGVRGFEGSNCRQKLKRG